MSATFLRLPSLEPFAKILCSERHEIIGVFVEIDASCSDEFGDRVSDDERSWSSVRSSNFRRYLLDLRLDVGVMRLRGKSHRMRQVVWSHEEDIDPIDREDAWQALNRRDRLNHRDDNLVVVVLWTGVANGFNNPRRGLSVFDMWDHDAAGACIEVACDQVRRIAFRSYDGLHAGGSGCSAHVLYSLDASHPVFAIDEDAIDPQRSNEFC